MNESRCFSWSGSLLGRAPAVVGAIAVAVTTFAGAQATAQSMPSHSNYGKGNMGDMGDMMLPDSAAPTGVVGGMNPKKGTLMPSITYMHMGMDGNRDGTDEVSTAEVLARPETGRLLDRRKAA